MKLKHLISTSALVLAGIPTNAQGQQSIYMCKSCPAGTYSAGGTSKSCTPCPAGQYQNLGGQTSCKACPANSTSSAGAKSIDDCICNTGYEKSGNSCVIKTCTVLERVFSSDDNNSCVGTMRTFQIPFGKKISASYHVSVAIVPDIYFTSFKTKLSVSCSGSIISGIIYSNGTTYYPEENRSGTTDDDKGINVSNSVTCK
ncbi:MAG: hypothetical protein K6F04_03275 [bacterium]|nr:hypothetical protein [bacterium]